MVSRRATEYRNWSVCALRASSFPPPWPDYLLASPGIRLRMLNIPIPDNACRHIPIQKSLHRSLLRCTWDRIDELGLMLIMSGQARKRARAIG